MTDHPSPKTTVPCPGFSWDDHANRIDRRGKVIRLLEGVAPMELPQAAWDRLADVVAQEIASGRAAPDEARDAWEKARGT